MSRRVHIAAVLGFVALATPAFAQQELQVYGYFATRLEKSWSVPTYTGTGIERESPPHEFGSPFFSLMTRHQINDRFSAYVNLNGSNSGALSIRNSWGEYSSSAALNVRVGRMYRKFGLYNEVLDAVPSYYGIEPPETFDSDHLIVSRTTLLMAFGTLPAGTGQLAWSLSTDNGEGRDIFEKAFPLAGDLNFTGPGGVVKIGASGYTSGGPANSDVDPGSGSPKSGILPWMERDHFTVMNGYAEIRHQRLTLQFEAARASHNAVRDAAAVVDLIDGAGPNEAQLARFLVDPSGAVDVANVRLDGDHEIQTWYARIGYSFDGRLGEFGPYAQWDYYSNPETIESKSFGGDAEAGAADDGKFHKATLGLVFRPVPQVAVKLDGSSHMYKLGGENVSYPELRFDVSYTFGL